LHFSTSFRRLRFVPLAKPVKGLAFLPEWLAGDELELAEYPGWEGSAFKRRPAVLAG